jgi:hypothetical protein
LVYCYRDLKLNLLFILVAQGRPKNCYIFSDLLTLQNSLDF